MCILFLSNHRVQSSDRVQAGSLFEDVGVAKNWVARVSLSPSSPMWNTERICWTCDDLVPRLGHNKGKIARGQNSILMKPEIHGMRFILYRKISRNNIQYIYIIPAPLSYFREGGPQKSKLHLGWAPRGSKNVSCGLARAYLHFTPP